MDIREFLVFELFVGFIITTVVTIFYGLVAPWYKQSAGRYIFGLLLSITLVLSNSVVRVLYPTAETRILGAVLFAFFIVAMTLIGVGIWSAQIEHYRRRKFIERERQIHNLNKVTTIRNGTKRPWFSWNRRK